MMENLEVKMINKINGNKINGFIFAILLAFLSCAIDVARGEDPQLYRWSSIQKLENGISVIFVDTSSTSTAILTMLCVSSGSTDEIEIKGVANILSKIFSRKLNENASALHYGSESSSYTGYDQSVYYFYGKAENLEGFIKNLGSVYSNFSFSKEDIDSCRQAEEQDIINKNQIDRTVASRESRKALYWHSGYGDDISGDLENLSLISDDDVRDFQRKNYKNARTTIIVAGKVDKKAVIDLVNKYFTRPKSNDTRADRLQEPPHHDSTTRITKYSRQISVPIVELYWKIPNYRGDRNKALATEIFVNFLDNWLQNAVIEGQKIAASMSFCYSFWNYEYGDFCIRVTARRPENVEMLINAITSEIKCIASDGITQEQANAAAKKLQGASNLVGMDMIDAVDRISKKLGSCCDYDFIKGFSDFAGKSCDLSLINAQAKEVFKRDPCVITVIMPGITDNSSVAK
jgi:predicted Zn-dependent peptidase